MDWKAFEKLSYGLYIVSAKHGEQTSGCVVNTLGQVTVTPVQVTVTVNKENYTTQLIQKSGYFTGIALARSADMNLIGTFGFKSSRDYDKFKDFRTDTDLNKIPYVKEQVCARFSCKVVDFMDVGTHIIFVGEVQEAELLDHEEPMTYAYYHQIKKGGTPPKASSYRPEPIKGFRCKVCGYILEADSIPDDFICPVCGVGKDQFERIGV